MLKSQLSVETLGRVWDLSDIDNDGCLDLQEFILAMHLIHRCVEGDMLPSNLPQNLVPPGKERYFAHFTFTLPSSDPFATPSIPSTMALVPLPKSTWSDPIRLGDMGQFSPPLGLANSNMASMWPQFNAGGPSSPPLVSTSQTYTYPPWIISSEEMSKASKLFGAIDLDADGLLSGAEFKLASPVNRIQLITIQPFYSTLYLPRSLPLCYLLGSHGCFIIVTHTHTCAHSEQFAVAMHLATEQLASSPYTRPLPAVLPPALLPPSLRPIPPDPTIFAESNKLIAEIEAINRERAEVEAAYTTLNVEAQRRASETASVQRTVDALTHTSRSLVNQRNEAERRLNDYAHERDTLASILNELKGHVASERQKVEGMRNQINSQQISAKSQEEEIGRLRNEVNDLIREEAFLQDRLLESRHRMDAIGAENHMAQTRIDKTNGRIAVLESTRGQLLEVLDQYTNLLNGTASGPVPDESKVKSLLNDTSLNGSLASFDTGLGGFGGSRGSRDRHGALAVGSDARGTQSGKFGDLDWSTTSIPRGLGAASVPLPSLSGVNGSHDRAHPVSAMGMPIVADPFFTADPFPTNDTATGKAPFPNAGTEKGRHDSDRWCDSIFSALSKQAAGSCLHRFTVSVLFQDLWYI
ncbi:Epidermal growth factor receptor substrate 15 [Fasciolopsis buskii]|uniref:Epidermal growth factor receptor substrate 15 n=1 Tax=Fasciolopsis buskii TaxID=27845 RepID=A0A8E0VJ73_9TREM|nr:Epidermal growth factor receptor substrate 15 [Fasciolopsis buski]